MKPFRTVLFSDNFRRRLDQRTLRDTALSVTHAELTGARRAAQTQNER